MSIEHQPEQHCTMYEVITVSSILHRAQVYFFVGCSLEAQVSHGSEACQMGTIQVYRV
jgi:hypothetical protein